MKACADVTAVWSCVLCLAAVGSQSFARCIMAAAVRGAARSMMWAAPAQLAGRDGDAVPLDEQISLHTPRSRPPLTF